MLLKVFLAFWLFQASLAEPNCGSTKVDLLYVVDGSWSAGKANFAEIKNLIENLNSNFDVGPTKTQIALLQFGEPEKTRIEFNLGEKNTNTGEDINQGVVAMEYLNSLRATGDALKKAREQVFNGKGGDRPDARNVLILLTHGLATDEGGKNVQVQEAKKLKQDGVMIITVAMGPEKAISVFRRYLQQMATKSAFGKPLYYESEFGRLLSISNMLLNEICVRNSRTSS